MRRISAAFAAVPPFASFADIAMLILISVLPSVSNANLGSISPKLQVTEVKGSHPSTPQENPTVVQVTQDCRVTLNSTQETLAELRNELVAHKDNVWIVVDARTPYRCVHPLLLVMQDDGIEAHLVDKEVKP